MPATLQICRLLMKKPPIRRTDQIWLQMFTMKDPKSLPIQNEPRGTVGFIVENTMTLLSPIPHHRSFSSYTRSTISFSDLNESLLGIRMHSVTFRCIIYNPNSLK